MVFKRMSMFLFMIFVFGFQKGEFASDKYIPNAVLEKLLLCRVYDGAKVKTFESEITAYCTEACCNSAIVMENGEKVYKDWSNMIAAGSVKIDRLHLAGIRVAAVDPSVIPFGSIIKYDGQIYAALDRGFLIRGTNIDLAMESHSEANLFGRRKNESVEVFIPHNPSTAVALIFSYAELFAMR